MRGGLDAYLADQASTQELADRVGAHRNTVAAHVRKLTNARFFLPAVLNVSPPAVGLARTRLLLAGGSPWTDRGAMEALLRLDGVKSVNEFARDWGVTLYAEDDATLDARIALLLAITRARLVRTDYRQPLPPRVPSLAARQLRLLAGLVGSERGDLAKIAVELGVSERTARRDFAALAKRQVVSLHFEGDANAEDATLAYVETGPAARAAIDALDGLIHRYETPAGVHAVVAVEGAAAVPALEKRLRAGGAEVHVRVWTRRQTSPHFFSWLRRVLLARARLLDAAR